MAAFSVPDMLTLCVFTVDEFKGHSLLQAAREADMAKAKKTLALEIINFKHPHTHETALVRWIHTQLRYCKNTYSYTGAEVIRWCFVCVLALCGSIAAPQEETGDGAAVEERRQRKREE